MACYFPTYPKAIKMNNPQHKPEQNEQDNLRKQEVSNHRKNQQQQQRQVNEIQDNRGIKSSELSDRTNDN
jgi:hypothetical protein